ncbi:hypothetical protein STEG23_001260 [Scotinomys teguina]
MNLPVDKSIDEDSDIVIQLPVHDWNHQLGPRLSRYEPVGDTSFPTYKGMKEITVNLFQRKVTAMCHIRCLSHTSAARGRVMPPFSSLAWPSSQHDNWLEKTNQTLPDLLKARPGADSITVKKACQGFLYVTRSDKTFATPAVDSGDDRAKPVTPRTESIT